MTQKQCCCICECEEESKITGVKQTDSTLKTADHLGMIRMRLGIGRRDYRVEPGLYSLGKPGKNSNVFVSANYKYSFDILRKSLSGMDAWILVLDSKGINVWCAAGKGTFGTEELIKKIKQVNLKKYVSHKRVIVPQLGAPGVAAHVVKEKTGFEVVYGPVRAQDIKAFIKNGMKADRYMRQVDFSLYERLKLTGVEFTGGLPYLLLALIVFIVLSGINKTGYSTAHVFKGGIITSFKLLSAYMAGTILGPVMLPWLPGRSFAGKGLVLGLIVAAIFPFTGGTTMDNASWILIIPAVVSFVLMNFTGASTYTSLSGVKKEMRTAVPLQVSAAIIGFGLWIAARFI